MPLSPQFQFQAGQALSAPALNRLWEAALENANIVGVAPVMVNSDRTGRHVSVDVTGCDTIWIALTAVATGAAYAWKRVIPDGTGGWDDAPGPETGTTSTDPAYEENGNASISFAFQVVVKAWRDPGTNALLFQKGSC